MTLTQAGKTTGLTAACVPRKKGHDAANDPGAYMPMLFSSTAEDLCGQFTNNSAQKNTLYLELRISTDPSTASASEHEPATAGTYSNVKGALVLTSQDDAGCGQKGTRQEIEEGSHVTLSQAG